MLIIVLTVANDVIIGAILPYIHAVFLVTKSFAVGTGILDGPSVTGVLDGPYHKSAEKQSVFSADFLCLQFLR